MTAPDDQPGGFSCSFVLPAFNEADNIVEAVESATKAARRLFSRHEVIVVDDGSTDATASIVERLGRTDPAVRLVRHGHNRGYGAALRTGFDAARLDLVFLTDSDNQFDLDDLDEFVDLIADADLVAGYRVDRQDTWARRQAAHAWNRLVGRVFELDVRDVDCAFKLFRTPQLQGLDLGAEGAMVSTELFVRLTDAGCRIVQRGVTHRPRRAGEASGADPRVVARAFRELAVFAWRLRRERRR